MHLESENSESNDEKPSVETKEITDIAQNIVEECENFLSVDETATPSDNFSSNDIEGIKTVDNAAEESAIGVDKQSSEGPPVDESSATVDENGVGVTVKSGYVLVPILTPYYDPSGK